MHYIAVCNHAAVIVDIAVTRSDVNNIGAYAFAGFTVEPLYHAMIVITDASHLVMCTY